MNRRDLIICNLFLCLCLCVTATGAENGGAGSFQNDVMAVLSRAGCNAGACHGNKNGKGGFKLSLRGQDPGFDYESLTRDGLARRANLLEPDRSLILEKPTGQIAHQGGVRFKKDSLEYEILRGWIARGAPRDDGSVPALSRLEVTPEQRVLVEPEDHVKICATAVFSDGSRRDVSNLCVYEQSAELAQISPDGMVRRRRTGETAVVVRYLQKQEVVRLAFVPARPDFAWTAPAENGYIDHEVFAKLKALRMNPSGPCTDGEFVRRAYLDLLGIFPTPEDARAYIADASAEKKSRLVDRLLERPEYADFWALKWSDLLRNEERTIDRKGVQAYHGWIRQSVAENKPLDRFVRELVSARGSTYKNPAANYYRANRDAVTRGEATAELFLGVRLQCARCHNHPFDRWTQDDYYNWADVFARVDYKILENRRTDTNDKHEFVGEQVVYEKDSGDVEDPRPGHTPTPRLLGLAAAEGPGQDRLDAVAQWITSPTNPFFARTQVNRIWFNLMGRGIVDPIDDFRATNPPSHPDLLDALARDFVAHGYDVRYMIRLIMASRVYALSAEPNASNADDETNYSHVVARRLSAEQLLDAEHDVMQVPAEFAGYPVGVRASQMSGVRAVSPRQGRPTQADQFLTTFGKPPRLLVCECERSGDTTLGQAFQLISGPETARVLDAPENRLTRLIAAGRSDAQVIDDLYWAALTRPPSPEELKGLTEHVRSSKDRRAGLEDVAWALLNSKEFVLRK